MFPAVPKVNSFYTIPVKILGLMSGTSADGIDAALCQISGDNVELLAFECAPYAPELRQRVLRAGANQSDVREIARLNVAVAEAFAAHANSVFERHGRAELIGSHGQTVCHLPAEGVTLQLGDGCLIAERTGVPVVSDFRQRDLASGGQGAPLVPFADWVTLRHPTTNRAILNLGGIANLTILPANCELEDVRAWDCGPGNIVIDALAQRFFGLPFDANGALAARGAARDFDLDDAFFARVPPKSCGREEFGAAFTARFENMEAHDALATATLLSARAVADSLRRFSGLGAEFELIASGGGAHNQTLMAHLRAQLPQATVLFSDELGINGDAREAMAFALMAAQTWRGLPSNVPGATGARESLVLGKISSL